MTELLNRMIGIKLNTLSKEELVLLKLKIFTHICSELLDIIRNKYKNYFHLIKFNTAMEEIMIEGAFLRHIINDILSTEEYSLIGIANYTRIPEEVIYEIAIGNNQDPSITLSRKIIELHQTVRPKLYEEIIKKIGNCSV